MGQQRPRGGPDMGERGRKSRERTRPENRELERDLVIARAAHCFGVRLRQNRNLARGRRLGPPCPVGVGFWSFWLSRLHVFLASSISLATFTCLRTITARFLRSCSLERLQLGFSHFFSIPTWGLFLVLTSRHGGDPGVGP